MGKWKKVSKAFQLSARLYRGERDSARLLAKELQLKLDSVKADALNYKKLYYEMLKKMENTPKASQGEEDEQPTHGFDDTGTIHNPSLGDALTPSPQGNDELVERAKHYVAKAPVSGADTIILELVGALERQERRIKDMEFGNNFLRQDRAKVEAERDALRSQLEELKDAHQVLKATHLTTIEQMHFYLDQSLKLRSALEDMEKAARDRWRSLPVNSFEKRSLAKARAALGSGGGSR